MTGAAPGGADLALLNSVIPVSRETIARLQLFRASLETWQRKTNLVSPSTLADFWRRHVADSLQCVALAPDALRWVDLGSGGGFPGMPIAIHNRERAGFGMDLVESIHKKCAFLRAAARDAGCRVSIHCERIESAAKRLAERADPPQIVTARALAALPDLLDLAEPLLAQGAVALFHKGRGYEQELRDCNGLWRFDLVVHSSRIEADSVLLEIRNLRRQ